MREERLLERIGAWAEGRELDSRSGAERMIASISRHLQRILNTRQGSVPMDPNYGVPDFTNLAGSFSVGSVHDMALDIQSLIERYEPRLKRVQVVLQTENNDVLSLRFELNGMIEVNDREIPIHLGTRVGADGQVVIGE